MSASRPSAPLLEVVGVRKEFLIERDIIRQFLGKVRKLVVINNVSLSITKGEVVGMVGESGSGKSTLAHLIVRLLEPTNGLLYYRGDDITHLPHRDLHRFRKWAQMIFQDTQSSLNPRKTVHRTLDEALRLRGVSYGDRQDRAIELLDLVRLGDFVMTRYPHELSGGQRQRVAIARALAMEPEFLIADEPVSSLDVSLQAQIINLLMNLQDKLGLTMLFISHDLAVVSHICNRVAVMYGGRIVEMGQPPEVLRHPAHPYTQTLIDAIPKGVEGRRNPHEPVSGNPPDPSDLPIGCPFVPRCKSRIPVCKSSYPDSIMISKTHQVSCHLINQ